MSIGSYYLTPGKRLEQIRRLRQGLIDFCPPLDNAFVRRAASLILPYRLRKDFAVDRVEVHGIERLQDLKGQRTILCPNHPGGNDPEVVFMMGLQAGEYYNYLAAREVFDENNGLTGWIMQRLGCYSVVRGTADRESFKTTKRLLVENKRKLVVFVEGEISRQNDLLMPLEPGVIQMSYWAIDELAKSANLAPVNLLPIGIKYSYTGDISAELERSLEALERELKVAGGGSRYERLRTVCLRLFAILQEEYDFEPAASASINETITSMRNHVLGRLAQVLKVSIPADTSTLDRVRLVRNALDDFVYRNEDELSGYERTLHRSKATSLLGLYDHIRRVQLFIAIYDGYLREDMTQDRFAEVLDKLELEVFGAPTSKGPRVASVQVGQPINLLNHYAEYKQDKRGTLNKLNDLLYTELSGAIKTARTYTR